MSSKRKEPAAWKLIKYILSSTGKGAIEGISIFKKKNKRETQEHYKEETTKFQVKRKNTNHTPVFEDLKIGKIILGDYNHFKKKLNDDSKIILIFGKRGSGKSALGLRIMENIKAETNRDCYTLGIDERFLPLWINPINNIDEANIGSIILVDEGAVSFNSRESMKETNKELSKIMAIARHKNLTLLFITQNTGMIDKNILKLTDSLMIKEGSLLQQEMERPEIKKFYIKSKELLENVKENKIKYFYLIDSDFEGLLEYSLPSFWTQELSKNKSSYSK